MSLITAAMADESMPPDRNTPSGTSAIKCERTASRNNSVHCSIAPRSLRAGWPFWAKLRSQYFLISI
jgi:hypothetical protein